ncbi:MAG: hypothetical protein PVI57_21675 [Gemmatimonadota bacterium]|jgi:hypothetical protein
MSAENHYALAALPTLRRPGAAPPFALVELLERVPPGRARRLAAAVLLSDDLRQREAWLAGELRVPDPAVLELAQLRGDEPLPEALGIEVGEDGPQSLPAEELWLAYARYVTALARSQRSPLLGRWIATEIGLRNRLVQRRSRALRLDPARYLMDETLEEVGPHEEAAVEAWAQAPDPLAGLRVILMARWRWLSRNEPWFTFRDEEFVAYAAKLILLHRWQRAGAGAPGGAR